MWVIFALLDPDTDPLTCLNLDPIRIRNTVCRSAHLKTFGGGILPFSQVKIHEISKFFPLLWVIFDLLDPDPKRIQIRIQIRNPGYYLLVRTYGNDIL